MCEAIDHPSGHGGIAGVTGRAGAGIRAAEEAEMKRSKGVMLVVTATLVAGGPERTTAQELPPDSVATTFVTDTIDDFGAVGGVVVDGLGYVYIADFRNAVWRLTPDGTLTKFADGLYGASGNAIGPRGDLYQSSFNGNFVSRISRTGEVERWADEGLSGPVGIAAAPDGTLFVVNCSAGSVARVAPDRSVSEFARHDAMACPNGITFDDRGDLYVVSFNDTRILKVTPDGSVTVFTDVPGAGGNGHITFARGAFFVTKLRGNQVYRVQRDGTVAVLAGTGAAGTVDGPALEAAFTRPNGIGASPSGDVLWVNDLTEGQGLGQGVSVVSLRRIRVMSLGDVLRALPTDVGEEALGKAHAAYHRSRPGEDSSAGAIALAYQWLSSGRVVQGVALFELNAELFSSDANAQFHFGEAYRYTGRPERAAAQYRRVLEIDPTHPNARARLAEVSSG
jgi:sugar lactone lactonase YvrE